MAMADAALLVADHDEGRETEAPAALHHLRHTIDVDELVDELARLLTLGVAGAAVAISSFAGFTCHLF
jgi:hypothetical protein